MAADPESAELYAELYSEAWILGALKILLESQASPDDVVNQYLAEEGYTMKVKGEGSRRDMIATLNAARKIQAGEAPFTGTSITINRGNRQTRT